MTDIRFDKTTLKIRSKIVLDNIDLHFEGDNIIGVVGNRFAGKNYLLPMLPSFRYPTSGTVTIDGIDVFENSSIMTKVAYTWPSETLYNSRKVVDGLKFCQKLRPGGDMKYAKQLLEMFDLDPLLRLRKLNAQNLAVFNTVCGLASRAPVTVFDGTFLRLSDSQRGLFYEEVRKDHKLYPRTIILSTNDISEIESFIEDAVILDKGKILAHETVDKITESAQDIMGKPERPSLQEVYLHFTEEGGEANGQ